jgi:hypothetical protein
MLPPTGITAQSRVTCSQMYGAVSWGLSKAGTAHSLLVVLLGQAVQQESLTR